MPIVASRISDINARMASANGFLFSSFEASFASIMSDGDSVFSGGTINA